MGQRRESQRVAIRHRAGEPVEHEQRCAWCGLVLIAWAVEEPLPPYANELFFTPGVELLDSGDGVITTAPQASEAPRCIPEVEGVHIE